MENLQELQNKIKRDPESYKNEFSLQYRHFESTLEIVRLKPHGASKEFGHLVSFCSHVAPCFPEETKSFPQLIMSLLEEHNQVLPGRIRLTLCSALILLRNRNLLEPTDLLPLFFRLFRCPDKQMRSLMFNHIVADVKNINKKHMNNQVNTRLQNFMFTMLKDNHLIAARMSLMVMTNLYKKGVWTDAKTVNVVATACTSKHVKLMIAAIRFFLNVDEEDEDSDDDDESMVVAVAKDAFNIHHKNVAPSSKKVRKYERALKNVKSKARKEKKNTGPTFTAMMLLYDAQGFAERMFARLKNSTDGFEVKLTMMNMISRLIGVHELLLLNYYPFLQRYLNPHQKDITAILAYMTQACHTLVPPDCLEPVVQTLANHFVNDRSSNEAMAIGLNTIREICSRQPLTMSRELLHDLAQYKTTKDKGVSTAAKSLIGLFREVRPELLHKKDRGKQGQQSLETAPAEYGTKAIADDIDGYALLREYEAAGKEVPEEDEMLEEISRKMNEEPDGDTESDGDEEDLIALDGSEEDELGEQSQGESGSEGEEEEDRDEADEDKDDEEGASDPPIADEPSSGNMEERILNDEDFEKIRRLKMMKVMERHAQGKRKRDDILGEDGLPKSFVTTDFSSAVSTADIVGHQKHKKATREDRLERMVAGREDRVGFGAKQTPKGGGSTNKEKKRNKNFAMVLQSDKVRGKATRSGGESARLKQKLRAAKRKKNKTKRRSG